MILAIRTDTGQAELYLLDAVGKQIAQKIWQADRNLSKEILSQIKDLLAANKTGLSKLAGLIVFQGPGSFTGLRIGITVANSLAYSLGIPVAGNQEDDWLTEGVVKLKSAKPGQLVMPEYGAEPNIIAPRK